MKSELPSSSTIEIVPVGARHAVRVGRIERREAGVHACGRGFRRGVRAAGCKKQERQAIADFRCSHNLKCFLGFDRTFERRRPCYRFPVAGPVFFHFTSQCLEHFLYESGLPGGHVVTFFGVGCHVVQLHVVPDPDDLSYSGSRSGMPYGLSDPPDPEPAMSFHGPLK